MTSERKGLAIRSAIPAGYAEWLVGLKARISAARQQAALAVNQELVRLYHHIGVEILERQSHQGWGAKVIDRLAADLREAFPEMKGFSSSNLKYMRFFAQMCPDGRIGQQPADQLPWFHIVTLLTKVSAPDQREWYAEQTIGSAVRCDTIGTKEETPVPVCRERPRKDFQGARPKGRRLRLGLQV